MSAHANGGGVAFFAHVGGFIFGTILARRVLEERKVCRSPSPSLASAT
ncbi:MAG TPA: hypothetical protein VMU39_09490 [Solirubrobacteraceae bacterium]|nr:hypothetical protein [Solirubrobacteraceae bacterium]